MREPAVTKRNNALKDDIRERDITRLAESWMKILQYYSSYDESPVQRDIIDGVLKVVGGWVSWIDITLIVHHEYLTLIFNCLYKEHHVLSTCDTLVEIIGKKMKPIDKIELIQLLGLKDVLSLISFSGNDEYDERIAKLSNVVALELVHILDGSTSIASGSALDKDQASRAEEMFNEFMPTVIHYLSKESFEISCQVLPSLSEYLAYVRKESKQEKAKVDTSAMEKNASRQVINFPSDSNFISSQQRAVLASLLPKLVEKMKYDEDTPWDAGEDESEQEFLEIRFKLKLLQDQIASIDVDLYTDEIVSVVNMSFDPAAVTSWRDVELGLFELTAFSDSLKNGAVTLTKGVETRTSRAMSDLFFKMINSNVVEMNHPSVQLYYIELVNKHCSLFKASNSDAMAKVLDTFVSPLGVHNPNRKVQVRCWYLFFRFIKSVRNLVGDISETVFTSIKSLLEIKAELPSQENYEEISTDAATHAGSFDSQLHLFELCGLLLCSSSGPNKVALLQDLFGAIFSDIEKSIQLSTTSTLAVLQIHHDLMAIGTFARGLNDYGSSNSAESTRTLDSQVFQQFKKATQIVITTLEQTGQSEIIRDAARFSISRLIPVLGLEILPEITRLISCLLEQCQVHELMDFFGFLGHLVHKFRKEASVFNMFESLMVPLFQLISKALNDGGATAANGSTDDLILKRDLKRAYLQLVSNILNNGMGALIFSKSDQVYEEVLKSTLTYAVSIEDGDDQSVKQAVLNFNKMLQVWRNGQVKEGDFLAGQPVPGFADFTLEHMSHISFEIPAKASFNIKDSQMRLLLGELASLQYAIFEIHREVYLRYLSERYLPSVGLPTEYINGYLEQLGNSDLKTFKIFFEQFMITITNK